MEVITGKYYKCIQASEYYIKDKIYKSEKSNCITDEEGDPTHQYTDPELSEDFIELDLKTCIATTPFSNVNSPNHYSQGNIECIDAIESALSKEEFIGFLRGNIIKYNWRTRLKNGIEDLEKSKYYIDKLIEVLKRE